MSELWKTITLNRSNEWVAFFISTPYYYKYCIEYLVIAIVLEDLDTKGKSLDNDVSLEEINMQYIQEQI